MAFCCVSLARIEMISISPYEGERKSRLQRLLRKNASPNGNFFFSQHPRALCAWNWRVWESLEEHSNLEALETSLSLDFLCRFIWCAFTCSFAVFTWNINIFCAIFIHLLYFTTYISYGVHFDTYISRGVLLGSKWTCCYKTNVIRFPNPSFSHLFIYIWNHDNVRAPGRSANR